MRKIGGEVEVGLESPPIEGLKFIKQRGRYSSGDVSEPGCVGGVGGEEDAKKD